MAGRDGSSAHLRSRCFSAFWGEDLFLRREAPFLVFGEDALGVDGHLEDAAAAADDLAVDSELFLDFRRQTGGARQVVSNSAVINFDLHIRSL